MTSNFKTNGTDLGDILAPKEWFTSIGSALWVWGRNDIGQLGLNFVSISGVSSPVQIGTLTDWFQVTGAGSQSLAIRTNGTLWGWGLGSSGSLGLNLAPIGLSNAVSSPTQVGTARNWRQVSLRNETTLAVTTSNFLWAWGYNNYGQLGLNDRVNRSSPTQVGGLTDWRTVEAGSSHCLSIKTNGTLWAWGRNDVGQLGLNTAGLTHRSSPIQVGSLTDWKQVSCIGRSSLALKNDGSIWTWGDSSDGLLGLNERISVSSPVQIGGLYNWKQVSSGYFHNVALRADGTLWSWGSGSSGRLGLNSTVDRSSPTQIGSLTDWAAVSASTDHNVAVKTNGTVWVWGSGAYGRLGLNNTANVSSPVQVGALTNWYKPTAGFSTSIVLNLTGIQN